MPAIPETDKRGKTASHRLETSLYALISTMQDDTPEEEDALIVSAVVDLLRRGRLTFLRPVRDLEDLNASLAEVSEATYV